MKPRHWRMHGMLQFIPCLIVFLSIHFTLTAQQTPGYIIKQNRDTVKGLIKTVVDADLSESVFFKIETNGEWTRYGYADLSGFGFENETFRSIRFLNTSKGNTIDTTFAMQLESGAYSLFTYANNGRRFFLLQKDTSISLLYDNLYSTTGDVEQAANYQNFLYFISIQCDKLKNKYKQVGYDMKSISDFVQKLNNCVSGGTAVSYYQRQKITATAIIFVGGLPVSRQKSQLVANLSVRFILPRVNNHLSLNIGLNYSSTTYMTTYNKTLNPLYRYYTLTSRSPVFQFRCSIILPKKEFNPIFMLGCPALILLKTIWLPDFG